MSTNPITMLKTFLLKLTTLVSQISVGVVLIGLMLFTFAILWTGLVYIANQLGDNTDTVDIEQVQDP